MREPDRVVRELGRAGAGHGDLLERPCLLVAEMDAGEADPAVDERVDEAARAPLCGRRLLERLADRRQELGVARERLRAVERTLRGHVRPQEPPLGTTHA